MNRRKANRIQLTPLAWLIGEREVVECILQDLSMSGARILLETALEVGEVAKLRITLPNSRKNILTVIRVVWQNPSENQHYPFVAGIEFVAVNKNAAAGLQYLISNHKDKEVSVQLPIRGISYLANKAGEIAGGSTASLLALPEAIAYGTIVFAPLGEEYVTVGVMAGLTALCLSNMVAAICGGVPILNSGPYSVASLMLASSVAILAGMVPDGNVSTVIALLFLVVFFCGLFQVLFGLLRFGKLVKYIPYPVVSGLFNGTAILICLGQIRPMIGMHREGSSIQNFTVLEPLTFSVGLVTILFIAFGSKLTQKIPAPFLGITVGTALFYLLQHFGVASSLGGTIGVIPQTIPTPHYCLEFVGIVFSENSYTFLPEVMYLACSIAIFASLQSLLASISADNLLREPVDTNRELIGQGLGNIASSFFGGIVSSGSQARTTANFLYGGRTNVSRLVSGLFTLMVIIFVSPLVAKLPKIVLAATVLTLAYQIFDTWSIRLVSLLSSKSVDSKYVLADLVIVVLVMATMLVFDVFTAVGVGLVISVVFFILRMGKNVVRRRYNGKRMRSNIHRPLEEIDYLEKYGEKIMLLELQGSLFFGTSDKVAGIINKLIKTEVEYIVVDLGHVSDIDSTGENILTRISDRCREKEKTMLVSSVGLIRNQESLSTLLNLSSDTDEKESRCLCFETIDDAFGWAEDRILDQPFGQDRYKKQLPLSRVDVLQDFSTKEIDILRQYLNKIDCRAGELVFEQGTSGDRVFFLVKGRAQVVVDLKNGAKRKSAILCPGTIFGEMAVIDRGVRSSNVVAETEMSSYFMTNSELELLREEHPSLSLKLLIGFARELSKRIRIANRAATELKG